MNATAAPLRLQFDKTVRVVGLSNLHAMCARVSGRCHRYAVVDVTATRVTVEYSNPDEYGNARPIKAFLPCYPVGKSEPDNRQVILEPTRYTGCNGDGAEDWQAFETLWDCPPLWRKGMDGEWQTEYEIRVAAHPEFKTTNSWDKGGCIQTYHVNGEDFPDYVKAQARAIELCKLADDVRHAANAAVN